MPESDRLYLRPVSFSRRRLRSTLCSLCEPICCPSRSAQQPRVPRRAAAAENAETAAAEFITFAKFRGFVGRTMSAITAVFGFLPSCPHPLAPGTAPSLWIPGSQRPKRTFAIQ